MTSSDKEGLIQAIFTEVVLDSHCRRVIDNMDHDDLYNYALQKMKESFDKNPGFNDTDVHMLIDDIIKAEGGDFDSVSEFLTGCGIPDEVIDSTLEEFQSEQKRIIDKKNLFGWRFGT
jgi:hypothetical protein